MTSYIPDLPIPGERMNFFPWRLSGLQNSWSSLAVKHLGLMDGLESGNSQLLTMGEMGVKPYCIASMRGNTTIGLAGLLTLICDVSL